VATGAWTPPRVPHTVYVGPGERGLPQPWPDGIEPYDQVDLAAEAMVTAQGLEHPDLQAAFMAPGEDLRGF
jgi:hypothetical protein